MIRKWQLMIASIFTLTGLGASLEGKAATIFADNFDRPNSSEMGNGWAEDSFWPYLGDMVFISDNRLRIAKTPAGANRDAVAYRPFEQACGIVVTGNVEWIGGNPYSAPFVAVNGDPSWSPGFGYVFQLDAASNLVRFYNDGVLLVSASFIYDLTARYNFEWEINPDCSSALRVWRGVDTRPSVPVLTAAPVTLPSRTAHLKVGGSGLGWPTYPDWEIRFDDIAIVELAREPGFLVASRSSVDFGEQKLNTSGVQTTIALNNDGGSNASITEVSVQGPAAAEFLITGNSCYSFTLAPDATCTVSVSFSPGPGKPGARAATLVVTSNALNSPLVIPLTGTAVASPSAQQSVGLMTIATSIEYSPTPNLVGHAWIQLIDFETESVETWGTFFGAGLLENVELIPPPRPASASRSYYITGAQRDELKQVIKTNKNKGVNAWTAAHNCSYFAKSAWHAITGETLNGISSVIPGTGLVPLPILLEAQLYVLNGLTAHAIINSCQGSLCP